ncbi:MAG: hypothetical protein JW841_10575 [Deltaproteobacteria bacterium]|nr:hypothetical protein [Deltaproteobacteria bacterium]
MHFCIDQIHRACDALCANSLSRQVVLQIWDVHVDLPQNDGLPQSADIPCNIMSMLKVRNSSHEWTQIMRSSDIFRGLPYNFLQFTTLQEIMAGWLGVAVGSFHHWSDSLHLYTNELNCFSCLEKVNLASNTDSLATDPAQGNTLINELFRRMDELTAQDVDDNYLDSLATLPTAPIAYQNLLLILGAESARRRHYLDLAQALMNKCTNPQLLQAWMGWWQRTQSKQSSVAISTSRLKAQKVAWG